MDSWVVPGYTEVRELGRGAAGRMVLAWHDPTGTPVAIRYLDNALSGNEDVLRALRRLFDRLTEVDSPHIIRYYEYVESADSAAIVMELVDGVSLREILDEGGPLDPLAAAIVLSDSLRGLVVAHTRGVLHQAYRAEHVLIDSEGRAKLIELTVGRIVDRPDDDEPGSVEADLRAATATYRECLTAFAVPPYLDGPHASAAQLLARVRAGAADKHGRDWERRGRDALAARAARLLRVSRAPAAATEKTTDRSTLWQCALLVGVTLALIVAVVATVTR